MIQKFLISGLIIFFCSTGVFAQSGIKWQQTFNTTTIPNGWNVVDADGSGSGLELVSTIAGTLPESGGAFWSSNTQNASRSGVINEWLISPRISVIYAGDSLYFWAGANDQGFDDSIRVKVSTTDNRLISFTHQLAIFKVKGPAGSWHLYGFDLSAFDHSDIYFAINYYIRDGGPGGQHSDFVWIDNTVITGDSIALNNAPTMAFLQQPANQSSLDINDPTINFSWSAAQDLDENDSLKYTLSILNTFPQMHFTNIADSSFSLEWQDFLNTDVPYVWTLKVTDGKSTITSADTFSFIIKMPLSIGNSNLYPGDLVHHQNYPNPFNPQTTIEIDLSENGFVQLDIFDIAGQRINQLLNNRLDKGNHRVVWDGRNRNGEKVASGIYIYQIKTAQQLVTKKMVLIK